jgi:isopenicillin-N epimerase
LDLPRASDFARHWSLDPNLAFLNHGSFGATPKVVQAAQAKYRKQLEKEPVAFFVRRHQELMDKAREAVASFVHCPADCLAMVPNATIGVATVLENLTLKPGDEILINDHEYPACQNNARRIAARAGAKVVTAAPPFPCPSPEAVIDSVMSKVTDRTRVALISHVTSPTGLVLPIERIIPELTKRGIETLIDGAHAPGMVPTLNINTLKPTYYTANCHKWICAPKGAAFLYVAPEKREGFRPVILSNHAEKPKPGRAQFLTEFDFIGTQDYTSIYAIPDAIDFMATLVPGGWPEIMKRNHALVIKGRDAVCKALNIKPTAPDSMVGSTCTMILPPHPPELQAELSKRKTLYSDALQDHLLAYHRVQMPVWGIAGRPGRYIRISAQLYNSMEQYKFLAHVLKIVLKEEAESFDPE